MYVVATQGSWKVMLISTAGDVWRMKEVEIKPNVKVECVLKCCCYLGDTLGAKRGVEETAGARVRCAWAESRSYLPFWQPALYHIIKGKMYSAWIQSVLTYGRWRLKIFIVWRDRTVLMVSEPDVHATESSLFLWCNARWCHWKRGYTQL